MRAKDITSVAGHLVLLLSLAIAGCNKLKRNDAAEAAKGRADVKREKAACGGGSVGDRLKDAVFDEAIARRNGDRSNLDVLADYSIARLEDPIVTGRDRSLDITRCKGHFILEVPPGAERGLVGERRLQADLAYTAQASADGNGFVYRQQGAEPMVTRIAAFNLAPAAYRPPPAIDEVQGGTAVAEQAPAPPAPTPRAQGTPAHAAASETPRTRAPRVSQVPTSSGPLLEPRQQAPVSRGSGGGEATVRAFYNALGAGNGAAASSQVIAEKRSSGAFSAGAISRFYGHMPEPLKLTGLVPLGGGAYRVTYRYSAGRSRCNGGAVVRLTDRGGRQLIRSIRSLTGC